MALPQQEQHASAVGAVVYRTPVEAAFEQDYLQIRELEQRVYSDAQVAQLPAVSSGHPHHREWQMRARSAQRFAAHIKRTGVRHLLDVGCGNGWFSALVARETGCRVEGWDINSTELAQAARVFPADGLQFCYADLFAVDDPALGFDAVVINSAVQYFPDLHRLLEQLFQWLPSGGAVHLIDSPFYAEEEVAAARERTQAYYRELGTEGRGDYYHHRTWSELQGLEVEVCYDPRTRKQRLLRKLGTVDSPFPWLAIRKP
ncbi:MAG: class I SAM-dependent methyltransferase [Bacteroidota bacterium]